MLEEVTPRKSRSWVPHSTFAAEMGLADKGGNEVEVEHHAIVGNKEAV